MLHLASLPHGHSISHRCPHNLHFLTKQGIHAFLMAPLHYFCFHSRQCHLHFQHEGPHIFLGAIYASKPSIFSLTLVGLVRACCSRRSEHHPHHCHMKYLVIVSCQYLTYEYNVCLFQSVKYNIINLNCLDQLFRMTFTVIIVS